MPAADGFVLAATRKGLQVLARNEDGLAAPLVALRNAYGCSLEIGPPRVRLIEGVQVQEPIMHIRISLETRFQAAVKRALLARSAVSEEEYERTRMAVQRYEAPLARLIGLPAELALITGGTARYWIVLSHYALVTSDPGGRVA